MGGEQSRRDTEKQLQKLKQLLGEGNKGTLVDIDEVGFDYLVIDEAHNFRNVFSYVPTDDEGNKRFKIQASDSARAKKAFFMCNYIQRKFGSNVMLLTATPFTNNPVEVYSLLSLVGYHNLQKNGILNLYDFMEQFIMQSMEYVNSYDGTIKQAHVVKAFNNRLVLQKLIFNHINYKTGEEAGVKRPCKINLPRTTYMDNATGLVRKLPPKDQLTTYLQMNDEQEENQQTIINLAQSGGNFSERAKNVMRAMAGSLDNALSPFIYDKEMPDSAQEFVEKSPKIHYVTECIRSVKEYHEDRGETISGQVIYMNRGKDYFKFIKQYLEEQLGFQSGLKYNRKKIDEVEIITSGINNDAKEHIKDAFLEGVCKVIIGTATIREGIDLQKNGSVIYNCYPDWNPTDVKQLEGRIWRQGNKFGYVRMVMPLVQNSMDVFVFQKLEEKTARVNDIWYRADRGNVLDVEALDPEDVKFALYTNLDELAKIVIDKDELELNRLIKIAESNIDTVQRVDYANRAMVKHKEQCLSHVQEWKVNLQNFAAKSDYYKARWGATDAQMKGYKERALEIVKDIEAFQEGEQGNKEMIKVARTVSGSTFANKWIVNSYQYIWDQFKSNMLIVSKAEKTVFQEKGYSTDTDFAVVIKDLEKEKADFLKKVEQLKSAENTQRIVAEIAQKKAENKVEGRNAMAAAEDFMSLNYLLQYHFNDMDVENCEIPDKNHKPQMKVVKDRPAVKSNHALKLKLKLKAKAIKVKLKLRQAA